MPNPVAGFCEPGSSDANFRPHRDQLQKGLPLGREGSASYEGAHCRSCVDLRSATLRRLHQASPVGR